MIPGLVERRKTSKGLGARHISSKVTPPHLKHLPLHAPKVRPMRLAGLIDNMEKRRKERIAELYMALSSVQPTLIDVANVEAKWRVPLDDLGKQRDAGLLEKFNGTHGYLTWYFTVTEKNDTRRRPIFWACDYLASSGYVSDFGLDTCAEYTQVVTQGSYAAAFDLKASYTQIELPDEVNFIVVGEDGELYRLKRLPYGVDAAAEIMQIVTEEMARLSAAALPDSSRFVTKAHIDNALGVGQTVDDVTAWAREFSRLADVHGITLNDEPCNTPSQALDFVGIDMDFKGKMVRLRERFIKGLPTVSEALRTYQDLESAVGKILYGMAVLRVRQHPYHFFIKTWRRKLARLNRPADDPSRLRWRDEPDLSPNVRNALERMLKVVKDNKWAPVYPLRTALKSDLFSKTGSEKFFQDLPIIVTDATLDSFGAVLYENGRITQAFGGRFDATAPSMAVAESAAALAAIARFADRIRNTTFVLLVDNTTTEISIARGHAKNLSIDLAVDLIDGILRDIHAKVLVARVASGDNVADAPSRAKPLKDVCIQKSLEAAEHAVEALKRTSVGDQVIRRARQAQARGGVGRGNVR